MLHRNSSGLPHGECNQALIKINVRAEHESAALRDLDPAYVGSGSDSTVLLTGRRATNVGCSPNSGGIVD
jgi:hypothetical protein